MFTIEMNGQSPINARLFSSEPLSEEDFVRIAAEVRGDIRRARKTGLVAALEAIADRRVETRWNGKESSDVAHPGDFIVTTLSPDGSVLRDAHGFANTYVVRGDRFHSLYAACGGDSEFGVLHRPLGVVDAIFLGGGFDIMAPWGERQQAPVGYLLRNARDIYGNNKETFEATYQWDERNV